MGKFERLLKRVGNIGDTEVPAQIAPAHGTVTLSKSTADSQLDDLLLKRYPELDKAVLDFIQGESPSIRARLQKEYNTKGISNALLATMETIQSAYVAPSVSGIGPAKQMLTEWWFNPIWGQPRLVDLKTIKQLARGHIGSMAVEAILDQVMQVDWDIVPRFRHTIDRPSGTRQMEHEQIREVEAFLDKPNRNNYSFDQILRMVLRNILETDDGTLVKVFDRYMRPPVPNVQIASTGDVRSYTAQPAWDAIPAPGAKLIEIYAEDGSSFLRQTDMHGYLMNYWQYSFIVPRRPVRFETNEIIYIMQNPRPGSPYGLSPFESLVDTLMFLSKAMLYGEHFYENSAIPALQIDYPWIKTTEEMKEMGQYLEDTFMGPDKAYRTLVTNGGAKVSTLNVDPERLQMLQMQNFYLQMVLSKLKVPASVLGIQAGGGRTGMGGGSGAGQAATVAALHKSRAIKPLMTLVENAFNSQLLPDILGVKRSDCLVEFKWGEIVDMEERERTAKVDQVYLATGVTTINEVRLRDGKDPVPWGNQPFLPQAALYAGLQPTPVQKPGGGGGNGGEKGEQAPSYGSTSNFSQGKGTHPFASDARQFDTPTGTTQNTASRAIGQTPAEGNRILPGGEFKGATEHTIPYQTRQTWETGPLAMYPQLYKAGTEAKANILHDNFQKLLVEARQRMERGGSHQVVIKDTMSAAKGLLHAIQEESTPVVTAKKAQALKDFEAILKDLSRLVKAGESL